jgi:hypothetical protein
MKSIRGGFCGLLVLALIAPPARAETVEQRLERMEREIQELRDELRRERAEKAAAPAPVASPAPVAAGAPAPAATAPPTAVASTPAGGKESLASRAYETVTDRVKLGGYGSTRFETSTLKDQSATFTYRRFVLSADAAIAPRMRSYLELEFERFRELELEKKFGPDEGGLEVEQTVEGTNQSEIAFEQAWFDYEWTPNLHTRIGQVLVPLGRFNLNHDDNRWDIARRSLVDRGTPVLPVTAAWGELGAGLLGDLDIGEKGRFTYEGYVVNGATLDVEFEQIAHTRQGDTTLNVIEAKIQPATGVFGNDTKDSKALTGRMAYSPELGHEVGVSGYWGQYTPDFLAHEDLWSVAADGLTGWGPFELEGEYVFTRYEGISHVARSLANVAINSESEGEVGDVESEVEFELANLARNKQGYWLEGRYRFWPAFLSDTPLGRPFDNPQLVGVVRGEQVWLNGLVDEIAFSNRQLTEFSESNRFVNRFTAGLAYRPVPPVVFQLAYEFTWTNHGESLSGVTNFLVAGPSEDTNHAVLIGAAFGF